MLGLNSSWQIDWFHRANAGIHPIALDRALARIRKSPDLARCLKVAVWHHPLTAAEEDRIKDHGFLQRLATNGFRLVLHGHIHKAENSTYRYDMSPGGRRLDIICAGTFGALTHEWRSGFPLQYNLLHFEGNRLTVETRRREEINGAWKPDARWMQGPGQDPLPRYTVEPLWPTLTAHAATT